MIPQQTEQASPNDFGAQVAAAGQNFAQSLDKVGQTADQIAINTQDRVNQHLANDALNMLVKQQNDLVSNPQTGYFNQEGGNAVKGYDDARDQADSIRQTVSDGLPNDAARLMFEEASRRQTMFTMEKIGDHAAQQNKIWAAQTSDARVQTSIDSSAIYYNDDKKFNQTINTIKSEADDQAAVHGWSDDVKNLKMQGDISKAIDARATAWAQHDPQGAQDWYRKNMTATTPDSQSTVGTQLQSTVATPRADATTQTIMAGGGVVNFPQVTQAIQQQESGGLCQRTSPAGAIGCMQLMPDTAKEVADKLGLPYDKDKLANDPEYNKQLGNEYFKEMCERYQGNQTLALAAYNAGPSNVDGWVKRFGNPGNDPTSQAAWAAKIPFPETKNYVQSINTKVPPPNGTPPTSDNIADHHADWQTQANNLPDGSVKDLTKAGITAQVNTVTQQQNDQDRTNRNTLLNGMSAGTLTGVGNLSDPAFAQAWAMSAPDVQRRVSAGIAAQKKDIDPTVSLERWYTLKGMARTDPNGFANYDLTKEIGNIDPTMFKELAGQQDQIAKGQQKAVDTLIPQSRLKEVGDPILQSIGINVKPKATDKDASNTYNAFYGRFDQSVQDFQSQKKQMPSVQDMRGMAQNLLATVPTVKSGWFGDSIQNKPAFQVTAKDVPTNVSGQIIQAFQSRYHRNPTDDELTSVYINGQKMGVK